MNHKRFLSRPIIRWSLRAFAVLLALALSLASWIQWGKWPDDALPPQIISNPSLIVVLGGGDGNRVTSAVRLAERYPNVPLLISGDGGLIQQGVLSQGIPQSRLLIEHHATSTWENAVFSKPWINPIKSGQIIIVTNDFHGPRSLAIFRKVFPHQNFVVDKQITPKPYNRWQTAIRRRERAAALYYLVRYRVNCFGN